MYFTFVTENISAFLRLLFIAVQSLNKMIHELFELLKIIEGAQAY